MIVSPVLTERIIQTLTITNPLSSLQSKTVRNVSYVGAAQIGVLLLTLLMVSVLTRLLSPEDFGIVSIGMVFMALFITIQDFGIAPAVIQRDTRVEEAISVGLTLRWLIAGVLLVVVVAVSPLIADYYDNDAVAPVLMAMSANLFIQPFAFSSYVVLARQLQFSRVAISTVAQYGITASVAIILAFAGFTYWSIVLGSLAGSACNVVLLNWFGKVMYRPGFDRTLAKELMGFGSHLLVVGLMAYVVVNVDQIVIGKVLGLATLGIYFVAAKFGRTLGEQIAGTVNKVLFPTMARMKDSIERLKVGYTQSLRMIAIVAVPVSMGLAALSPLFVSVVLGGSYERVAVPLAILSFHGLLKALIPPAANVLIAIGKPKYMSVQSTVQAVFMVALVYPVALYLDIEGVCYLTTLLSLGVLVYFLIVFSRLFRSRIVDISRPMGPAMMSGFVTFVVLAVGVSYAPSTVASLLVLSGLGACLYLACLHVFSRGRDFQDLIGLVRNSFFNA